MVKHLLISVVIFLVYTVGSKALAIETSLNHNCSNNINCYFNMGYSDLFLGQFPHILKEGAVYSNSTLSIQTNTSYSVTVDCEETNHVLMEAEERIILRGFSFGHTCIQTSLANTPEIELIDLRFSATTFEQSIASVYNFTHLVVHGVIFDDNTIFSALTILKGGCLRIENGGNVEISDSLFLETKVNAREGFGGVFYINKVNELTVQNTAFRDSNIEGRGMEGGSLFIGEEVLQASFINVVVSSSKVSTKSGSASTDKGCGVYLSTNASFVSCVFVNNSCDSRPNDTVGHSIFADKDKTVHITDSIFINDPNKIDFVCGGVDCSSQLSNECTSISNQSVITCDDCSNSICCGDISDVPTALKQEFNSLCEVVVTTDPPPTSAPTTKAPVPAKITECSDNSCLTCDANGCFFNGSIAITGSFIIDQPTLVIGNVTNKGILDIIVTDTRANTLTVTGCVIAGSNDSSIQVDLTGSQSSSKQVTVIKTTCFAADITVTTKECVFSTQKNTGREINVFTFPVQDCNARDLAVLISVLVTMFILLLVIGIIIFALVYSTSFRASILPFNIYKQKAGNNAGVVSKDVLVT